MRWLTNAEKGTAQQTMRELQAENTYKVVIHAPKASEWVTFDEMVSMGLVGLYAVGDEAVTEDQPHGSTYALNPHVFISSAPSITWPDVFSQPLDAPYMPEASPDHRKMAAVADGLMAWGNCHLVKPPENFGYVVMKLARESGISNPSDKGFSAAAAAIMKEDAP
jgi:hypothetical protein